MPVANELHNSYMNSLKVFTRQTGITKVDEKKNDELGAWSSKNKLQADKMMAMPAFPLTSNMLLLSLLFWVGLSIVVYLSIIYGLMLSRITEESDLDGICYDTFNKDKTQNMKRVENYSIGEAGPYLLRLRPTKRQDFPVESDVLPPLVTGVTSAQFYQVQGLIKHIQEDIKTSHPSIKLIVYDLGLHTRERKLMEQYGNCEIRDLHFEQYPRHVSDIANYAWRPIVIQLTVEEYGSVLYIEPTTRFKSSSSPNYLRMRGSKNYFVWDPIAYTSLIAYTDKGMFDYFNENRCAFLECSLVTSEAIAVYRTEVAWTELMRPWLLCALNVNCISPKYAKYSGCFEIRHPRTTGCHRYDMSALSVILNRGVQYTIDSEKMMSFRLTYSDPVDVTYFPEQPWTYTYLFLLLAPVLFVVIYKYFFKRRRLC